MFITPFFDGIHYGREIVVGEDPIRCFLSHICAGKAHRDTDVSFLQRRRIVHPVTSDGNDMTQRL